MPAIKACCTLVGGTTLSKRHPAEPAFTQLSAKTNGSGERLRKVHLYLGIAATLRLWIALTWGFKRQGVQFISST